MKIQKVDSMAFTYSKLMLKDINFIEYRFSCITHVELIIHFSSDLSVSLKILVVVVALVVTYVSPLNLLAHASRGLKESVARER